MGNKGNENIKNDIKGNQNITINGNDNEVTIDIYEQSVTTSTLYKICKILYKKISLKEINEIKYDTKKTSDWLKKLEYNKIEVYYKNRFLEISEYLLVVEEAINALENQDNFIKWLHKQYKNLCIKFPEKTKEQILVELNEKLENILKEEKNNDVNNEDLSLNIDVVLFYGFTKCKILEPVPKE